MKNNNDVISKTIDYIENHLNEDLKLEDIAKAVGYSKFHLNRMFSQNIGKTIHKYIQKRRLTEAAKKLIFTEKPIVEIAYEAKYESQQAFTLAFRQLYTYTPQVYRNLGVFRSKQDKITMGYKYVRSEGMAA